MKVSELFEAHKSIYARMAAENRARKQKEREEAKKAEAARKTAKKQQSKIEKERLEAQIFTKVEDAISMSFPDGDPFDHLVHWLNARDLTMDDVNRVLKKKIGITYDKYLSRMWDDAAADAVSDAEMMLSNGKTPHDSPFYHVADGKVVREPNPWK